MSVKYVFHTFLSFLKIEVYCIWLSVDNPLGDSFIRPSQSVPIYYKMRASEHGKSGSTARLLSLSDPGASLEISEFRLHTTH